MRFRDQLALTLPALILRLVLALTFLWAGVSKVVGEFDVTGDDAARLARMGVSLTETTPPEEPVRDLPAEERPPPTTIVVPEDNQAIDQVDSPPGDTADLAAENTAGDAADVSTDAPLEPGADAVETVADPAGEETAWTGDPESGTTYSPDNYAGTYRVQRVAGIALLLSRAANPGLDAESSPIPRTMPVWAGTDRRPIHLAWAAAITELIAAFLLFFGVLTRIGAVMIVGVMATAMWLTQFGPAAIGLTDSYLGFIPKAEDAWAPSSYATLLWQLACFGMAAAVFMLGSGPVGFDRAIWRRPERLERTEPDKRERTVFDRGPNETP